MEFLETFKKGPIGRLLPEMGQLILSGRQQPTASHLATERSQQRIDKVKCVW